MKNKLIIDLSKEELELITFLIKKRMKIIRRIAKKEVFDDIEINSEFTSNRNLRFVGNIKYNELKEKHLFQKVK